MRSRAGSFPGFSILFMALLIFAAFILISCGTTAKNITLAETSVDQFHSQLDTEQYTALYASTDPKFHQVTSEGDFVKLLQAIHTKLGSVREANLRGAGAAWHTGTGATVSLVYETKFAQGTAKEQFVWHISDNSASLYGYHINSNDLISK
jgi:hypothetical protein